MRILAQVRRDEKVARRKAVLDAQFAARVERRAARARGDAPLDSDDEENAGFDSFAVFANLAADEQQVAPVAALAEFDAFAVFANLEAGEQAVPAAAVAANVAVAGDFDAFVVFASLQEQPDVAAPAVVARVARAVAESTESFDAFAEFARLSEEQAAVEVVLEVEERCCSV
jgi:hypothetical protein